MTLLTKLLLVAMGGASGALARFGVYELVAWRLGTGAPVGTLVSNILGCFLIGCVWSAVEVADWGTPAMRLFVLTGFLGAFTTFSTFEADTVALWRVGARWLAVLYMSGSVVGGLLAFFAGWGLAGRVGG